jgi:pSer/pThr/pTyr-binding forkhead associated (FHA) protein
LLVRARPGETRSFELRAEESVIGRDEGLAVALPLEEVSRRHARIVWDGKHHWLEDLQSTNGTFLNGRRLGKEREKLRHLSVVTLGKGAELVFVLRAEQTETLLRTVIAHAFLARDGDDDALPFELPVGEFTVGRSAACNIVTESREVSKVHARLLRAADKLMVRDLGSANGTAVNGVRVAEAPLVDGDLVSFAGESYRVSMALTQVSSATTKLRIGGVAAAAAPAPEPPRDETPRFSPDWKQRALGPSEAAAAAAANAEDETGRGTIPDRTLSAEARPSAGRLEVRLAGAGVELVVPGGGSHVLGSGPSVPLRVQHASVAEAHARLIVSAALGTVFVQKEGGRTRRNGRPVERPEPLADGDVLSLSEVELKVTIRRLE